MPWFDVEESLYEGSLSNELESALKSLRKENRDFTGVDVCKDIAMARDLLAFSNKEEESNEIIAVRSETLVAIKGAVLPESSVTIEWCGFDYVELGHWSLLREGIFGKPREFSSWLPRLNRHGLISSIAYLDELKSEYQRLALAGIVEELPESVYSIDALEIGTVR